MSRYSNKRGLEIAIQTARVFRTEWKPEEVEVPARLRPCSHGLLLIAPVALGTDSSTFGGSET